jgi:hypothetical protein
MSPLAHRHAVLSMARLPHPSPTPSISTENYLSLLARTCKLESATVRLPNQCSADELPTLSHHCLLSVCINQLDKADGQLIPGKYIYLLGMQCLVSLFDGLTRYTFPLYNTLAVQKPPVGSMEPACAPDPLNVGQNLARPHAMPNAEWPVPLMAPTFLLTPKLFNSIFSDV